MEQLELKQGEPIIQLKRIPEIFTFEWFSLGDVYQNCLQLYGNQCQPLFWRQLAHLKFKDLVKVIGRKNNLGYFFYYLAYFIWNLEKILRQGREIVLGGQVKIGVIDYCPKMFNTILPRGKLLEVGVKINLSNDVYHIVITTSYFRKEITIYPDDFVRLLMTLLLNSEQCFVLYGDKNLVGIFDRLNRLLGYNIELP